VPNGCLQDWEECLKNKNSPMQILVCIGLFLTNIPYHKLANHLLPLLVLNQIKIPMPITEHIEKNIIIKSIFLSF
jgi:hypothetical protein